MDNLHDKRSEFRLSDEIAVFIEMESAPDQPLEKNQTPLIGVSKTLDISANGVQILIDSPRPLNSLVQLCLQAAQQRFYVIGEVMWLRAAGEEFLAGFQLLESEHSDIAAWKEFICRRLDVQAGD